MCAFRGVGGECECGCCGICDSCCCCCNGEVRPENGVGGRQIAFGSLGGDCESLDRGNVLALGELKEVGGAEPAEYTDTDFGIF